MITPNHYLSKSGTIFITTCIILKKIKVLFLLVLSIVCHLFLIFLYSFTFILHFGDDICGVSELNTIYILAYFAENNKSKQY